MSTDLPKAFLLWTYPYEVLQQRTRIIEELVRYVVQGVENPYGQPTAHPKASALLRDVRSRMFEAMQRLVLKRQKSLAGIEGSTEQIVLDAFKDAQQYSMVRSLRATPHFSSTPIQLAFEAEFKTVLISTHDEAEPTVLGAYSTALMNFYQTESRLCTLYALSSLLRPNDYSNQPPLDGAEEIRTELWRRAKQFLLEIALFGGLLGGKYAAESTRFLTHELCQKENPEDIKYSVIQFLQADGRHPGRFLSETEELFRNDIAEKYNALKGMK